MKINLKKKRGQRKKQTEQDGPSASSYRVGSFLHPHFLKLNFMKHVFKVSVFFLERSEMIFVPYILVMWTDLVSFYYDIKLSNSYNTF